MKISAHAFARFWDVHAWAGVLGGLVLYVMFVSGATTLFHAELETWEDPLAHEAPSRLTHEALFERAAAKLPDAPDTIWLIPKAAGAARIGYVDRADSWRGFWIEGAGELVPQRERLAHFLYELHFLWHDATGDWLYRCSGFLAVLLLLAIVTGVLIHLKDIVRQFHQFRPEKSRRVFWSDMHKVLGVMGLPFQLLYAYTGALIVLAPLLIGVFAGPLFGGDRKRAEAVFWGVPEVPTEKAGARTAVLSLDELRAKAQRAEPSLLPETYRVVHAGRENGVVDVYGPIRGSMPETRGSVRLGLVDGKVLHVESAATETAVGATWRWVRGLHYAHFGGFPLRLLFFVLALATAGTILTGNWVWLARREARRRSVGNRVLARLTAGVGAGTFVAMAALFLASRVLPLDLRRRGTAEELVFLGALAFSVAWAFLAKNERALFWQQLGVAGVLLFPVPLLAARWSSAGLFGAGPRIVAVAGVDIALLIAALALCGIAFSLRRATTRSAKTRRPAASDEDSAGAAVPATAGGRDA